MLRTRIAAAGLAGIVAFCAAGESTATSPKKKNDPAPTAPERETKKWTGDLQPPLQFEGISAPRGAINRPVDVPQLDVAAIVQDRRGFMWFGTQNGLARYDSVNMRNFKNNRRDPNSISNSYITALAPDPIDGVWVGTGEGGVNYYNSATDQFEHFRHVDTDPSSLSHDGVTALFAGRDQIWVALADGSLDSIDPTSHAVRHVLPPEKTGAGLITLYESDGALWAGTAGAGLLRLNLVTKELVTFQHIEGNAKSLSNDSVTALVRDREGALWVGTASGLGKLSAGQQQFENHFPTASNRSLPHEYVTSLLVDDRARLWVGTKNGLALREPGKPGFTRFVNDSSAVETWSYPSQAVCAFQDKSGMIWFGDFGAGVRMFDRLREKFHHYRPGSLDASVFTEDADGRIWVGSYTRGLYKFDRAKGEVTIYTVVVDRDGNSLELNQWLNAVHADRRGTIWVARHSYGLIGFNPRRETFVGYPYREGGSGPSSPDITKIVEAKDGTLWLGTWGGGLDHFDPRTGEFTVYVKDDLEGASTIASDYVYTIAFDRFDDNILWIGTAESGLNRFDISKAAAERFVHSDDDPDSIAHNGVLSVLQEKDGALWVGTYGGGLDRFDPKTKKFAHYTEADGLSNNTVYGILEDEDGRLWLSTNGGGLSVFEPGKATFTTYTRQDGLQGDEFSQNAYFKSRSGEMFFSGPQGFNAFSPREISPDSYVPELSFTGFRLFNKTDSSKRIWQDPRVDLGFRDSVFSIDFASLAFAGTKQKQYQYQLEGFVDHWIVTSNPEVTFTSLDGGNYTFRVKGSNRHGVWSEKPLELAIHVDPPPWKAWWAYMIYGLIVAGIAVSGWRYQHQRIIELERKNRLAAVERDLDLTGAVQAGFLPKQDQIKTEAFGLQAFYQPADHASGDWWWYERTRDGHHAILVGDVTGHGPGPAMVTAAVATSFRVQSTGDTLKLVERLEELNRQVRAVGQGRYHMTMSVLDLDERSGRFKFFSAGGLPPAQLKNDGSYKVYSCRGTPLGSAEFVIGQVEGQLAPGERVIVLTDGIPEIKLKNGRMLGMRGLCRLLVETRDMSLADAVKRFIDEAGDASGKQLQDDDWTFALIQWRDSARALAAPNLAHAPHPAQRT